MTDIKVDINLLKELRAATGVGFNDCRNALIEANNDFDKALEILKVKGLSKAMSKVNNEATEGVTKVLIDKNRAVIVEVNCQTDFVANNLEFNNVVNQVAVTLLKSEVTTVAEALALAIAKDQTVKDLITNAITKLGENIVLKRFQILTKQDDEIFGSYVHTGAVSAGLVVLSGTQDQELAKNIAMQLVAMKPKFIDVTDIDESVRAKELAVAQEQIKGIEKPQEILEKMVQGKVNKALAELTITSQPFIKDSSVTIKQYLERNNAKIKSMIRYEVGELVS